MRIKFSIYPRTDVITLQDGLKRAIVFEEAGFDAIWEADHYLPEVHTGGHVSDVTVMLEEYLNHTRKIVVGPMVVCPIGFRSQPGDIALRYAIMASLHPGRVALCAGAGCAAVEKTSTGMFPPTKERRARLEEAIRLIRECWTSDDYVAFNGRYFNTLFFLYDKPETPIPIYLAASGPKSARLAGRLADGFVGLGSPEYFKEKLIPEFERGVADQNRNLSNAEKMVFIPVSYNQDRRAAYDIPRRMYGYLYLYYDTDIDPRIMEQKSSTVGDDLIEKEFCIATSSEALIERFDKYVKAGVNHIVCYDVSDDPSTNLAKIFKDEVFPYFRQN
jgi:coenzyme F420-dependent glucose-6-phosphate dehydrogenase